MPFRRSNGACCGILIVEEVRVLSVLRYVPKVLGRQCKRFRSSFFERVCDDSDQEHLTMEKWDPCKIRRPSVTAHHMT
jgi:hypothetical protein